MRVDVQNLQAPRRSFAVGVGVGGCAKLAGAAQVIGRAAGVCLGCVCALPAGRNASHPAGEVCLHSGHLFFVEAQFLASPEIDFRRIQGIQAALPDVDRYA